MSLTLMLPPEMERQREKKTIPHPIETDEESGEIRRGIPKLSALRKLKAILHAHWLEERQVRRVLGASTLEDEVPRRRTPTEQSPPANAISNSENSEARGSTAGRSEERPPVLEPPQQPPSALYAPPVPVQAVESHCTLTETHEILSDAQLDTPRDTLLDTPPDTPLDTPLDTPPDTPRPAEQTCTTSIAVSVPMSKLERLREMEFRSSIDLMAQEIRLTKHDIEKLRTFSEFVGTPNQKALFGRQLPQCHRYVVQLELEGSQPQIYICIDGLKKKKDIRDFYAVMSQKKYRKYYEPWKICFRLVNVLGSASTTTHGPGVEEAAANYQIRMRMSDLTLAGSRVRLKTETGERISTIGGTIQLGDKLYAMTTAHGPLWQDSNPSELAKLEPPLFKEEDFPDDVEEAVVFIDFTEFIEIEPAEASWAEVEQLVAPKVYEHHGDDWCLIPIPERYQLPNAIYQSVRTARRSSTIHVVDTVDGIYHGDPGGLCVCPFTPGELAVGARMALAPSFLDGSLGPMEVWAVKPQYPRAVGLRPGDSGTWYVTASYSEPDRSESRKVVGQVVARTPGKTLITLLSHQLESISKSFPTHPKPAFPRSVPMLLRAAKNFYAIDYGRSEWIADRLLDLAKSGTPEPSALMLTLHIAYTDPGHDKDSDMHKLKTLIMRDGEDLERNIQQECSRLANEEGMTPSSAVSPIQKLALIYQRYQILPDERSLPGKHVRFSELPPPVPNHHESPILSRSKLDGTPPNTTELPPRLTSQPTLASSIQPPPGSKLHKYQPQDSPTPTHQETTQGSSNSASLHPSIPSKACTPSTPPITASRQTTRVPRVQSPSSTTPTAEISHTTNEEPRVELKSEPEQPLNPGTEKKTSPSTMTALTACLNLVVSIIHHLYCPSLIPKSSSSIFLFVVFVSYYAGLGVALGFLMRSDLTVETKIGVGIALFALAGLGGWIIYSRRKRRRADTSTKQNISGGRR